MNIHKEEDKSTHRENIDNGIGAHSDEVDEGREKLGVTSPLPCVDNLHPTCERRWLTCCFWSQRTENLFKFPHDGEERHLEE
jgi:hypothetical protein